jgi:hypothetical protein
MTNTRIIFPTAMFVIAGISFAYGTWQFFFARQVQIASDARLAYIVTTIERSDASRQEKQELYATIMSGLPPAPLLLGIDVSGSFATQQPDDQCISDGQRAVCRALLREGTDQATYTPVCGLCNPQ